MKLLKEIIHKEGINLAGKTVCRETVRGIITKEKKILMIYSPKNGDYKFPGGGVNNGESYEEALIREVQEESGAIISTIEKEFGKVIEYDLPLENDYDVFKMTSFYYICKIETVFNEQSLDQYEKDLGFEPVWVDIDVAIKTNKYILNSNKNVIPRWTLRETFVLEQVKKQLLS